MAVRDDLETQFVSDGLPVELVELTLQAAALIGADLIALPTSPFGSVPGTVEPPIASATATSRRVQSRPGWRVELIDGGAAGEIVVLDVQGRVMVAPRMSV